MKTGLTPDFGPEPGQQPGKDHRKGHGLALILRVFAEGLVPEEVGLYREKADALREAEPALRRQREEVELLLKGMTGKEKTERYAKALALEREVLALLDEHRLGLLQLGAAGRLLGARDLDECSPWMTPNCSNRRS